MDYKYFYSLFLIFYVDFDQFKIDTENNISKINSKLKDISNASIQNTSQNENKIASTKKEILNTIMLDIGSNIKIDVDSKILSKSIESFINNDNSEHNPISEFRNEIKKLQKIVTNINEKDSCEIDFLIDEGRPV